MKQELQVKSSLYIYNHQNKIQVEREASVIISILAGLSSGFEQ
jgi:hypothetical protein